MKLNALLKTLGFLALAATPVVAGPSAPVKNPIAPAPVNDDLGITASLGYDTNYVWRGLNIGSHWVRAGLNGSVLLVGGAAEDGAGSTALNWDVQYGSLAGDQDHLFAGGFGNASFQRVQLGAALSHDFGPASVNLGYRYYRNMGVLGGLGGMNDGQEVSLGFATALGPINLSSSGNYDFVNNYWYFDLNASSTIAVTDAISIVPYATLGYGHNMNWQFAKNTGVSTTWNRNNVSNWTAVTTGIQLPIKLNSRATLTPYIAVNIPMSGVNNLPIAATSHTAYNTVLFGGVTLSVRF
ncbi:hypothetical protein [Prosthecobacter sp.]|uniref:hypothetical protein n=1 Tax=Prosthecobacter sp. TaxID=1965333 RepID=UPI003783438B